MPIFQAMRLPSALLVLSAVALTGCGDGPDLVVRVSLDQVFSEALMKEFEASTGLEIVGKVFQFTSWP